MVKGKERKRGLMTIFRCGCNSALYGTISGQRCRPAGDFNLGEVFKWQSCSLSQEDPLSDAGNLNPSWWPNAHSFCAIEWSLPSGEFFVKFAFATEWVVNIFQNISSHYSTSSCSCCPNFHSFSLFSFSIEWLKTINRGSKRTGVWRFSQPVFTQ